MIPKCTYKFTDKRERETVTTGEKIKSKTCQQVKDPNEKLIVVNVQEKRKRNIDTKLVQEFMKNQKLKRLEQIKIEKKSKVKEKEAIKRKLEELRIKTLKLAAQSKKKKVCFRKKGRKGKRKTR